MIILGLLALSVYEGTRIGFLTQIFVIAGSFGALFIGGWLFPHLLPIHDPTLRTVVNASLVLLTATYAGMRSFDLAQKIHWSFRLGKLRANKNYKLAETALGSLPGIAAGLIFIWLIGVAFGRLPFAGFSNSVSDSFIVQQLTRHLPPVPAVFAEFDRQVNPNDQPRVSDKPTPSADFNYSVDEVRAAEAKAAKSVVRITSFGCGGLVSGSGFVAGPELVVTNAHVVAGVKRPIIKYGGDSYEAVPVFFDSGIDLAVLRVRQLGAPALKLAPDRVKADTTVAILGYPGGNYSAAAGIIRDDLSVTSFNIYDQGSFTRAAYGIQTTVKTGSSGGPVVLKDGRAAGMIFSQSTDTPNYAYALTASYLKNALDKTTSKSARVNTGGCTVE